MKINGKLCYSTRCRLVRTTVGLLENYFHQNGRCCLIFQQNLSGHNFTLNSTFQIGRIISGTCYGIFPYFGGTLRLFSIVTLWNHWQLQPPCRVAIIPYSSHSHYKYAVANYREEKEEEEYIKYFITTRQQFVRVFRYRS